MKSIIVLIVVTIVVISSCSKKVVPFSGYNQIKKTSNTIRIDIASKQGTKAILKDIDNEFKLSLNDSVLIYQDTIYSNFQLFSFSASIGKVYKIQVYSLCDCLGFKKYMFNPEIKVYDLMNEVIETRLDSTFFGYSKGPISLGKYWHIKPKADTEVNIVLYSNNEALEQDIHSFIASGGAYTGAIYIPLSIPIKIKTSLIGKFIIRIEEE